MAYGFDVKADETQSSLKDKSLMPTRVMENVWYMRITWFC